MPFRTTRDFFTLFAALLVYLGALAGALFAQAQTSDQTAGAPSDQIIAVPNRPTFSTTAETTQRGVFEIEYGLEAADGHQDINGLLKFGLLKNLELRLANIPFIRNDGVSAFGDLGAGFKYRFVSQTKPLPSLAVLYTATLPTAGNDLGAGTFGHALLLLASKDFGKNHFDWNEGVQFAGRTGPGATGFDRNYFSAFDYSHPLSKNWGMAAEIAGFSKLNAKTPANMTLLGAATYNVSSRFVLDAGAYFAAFGNIPRVTGFAGLTYSVGDLYKHLAHRRRSPCPGN